MTELKFEEYWIVILNPTPDYNRESPEYPHLMKQHFEFIDHQINIGNMFIAVPMTPGGLYIFDGSLEEEFMTKLLKEEGSIKGGVFNSDLRKGYVPDGHLYLTLKEKKKIDTFREQRRNS